MSKCFNMYSDYVTIEITLIIIVILAAVYLIYSQQTRLSKKENFTEHLPTLTMYYTNWCGHSKKMLPIFNSLNAGYLGKVHFINVD